MIGDALIDAGFRVDMASDGIEALKKANEIRPLGMVLDVGLPGGVYGFELCEQLKGSPATKDIKIVLLSSVYDKRKYKRKPTSLYGADDYVEKHHIPDSLPIKLRKLIFPEQFAAEVPKIRKLTPPSVPEMSHQPANASHQGLILPEVRAQGEQDASHSFSPDDAPPKAVPTCVLQSTPSRPETMSLDASDFQKEECDISRKVEVDPEDEDIEKARRFARIIISDIALYNQETVLLGIKNGNLLELLKNDVDEGRELYEQRVIDPVRVTKDYYQEALDNFITAARRNLRSEHSEKAP